MSEMHFLLRTQLYFVFTRLQLTTGLELDTSCRPVSSTEAFASSTSTVSPIGTSIGMTTPLELLDLS